MYYCPTLPGCNYAGPIAGRVLRILALVAFFPVIAPCQQGTASIGGTIRGAQGELISGAAIQLQAREGSVPANVTHSDAAGKYRFSNLQQGVYLLTVISNGYRPPEIPPVFLGPTESKSVDLTLLSGASASNNVSTQPQFFDEPRFTVAGVTDATSLGGHGSDTIVRTRENIARATASLGNASPAKTFADSALEKSLREQADRDPSSFEANHRLGALLIQEGKPADALPYLQRAAAIKAGEYKNTLALATADFETGNLQGAHETANTLLESHDNAEVHHLLANVEEKQGDSLQAVRQYERAAELEPSEHYLFDWASELLLHHAAEPALQVFAKGNRLFPDSVRMLIGFGAASFARGSTEEAIRRICEASDLVPNDPAPYLFLGKMLSGAPSAPPQVVEKLHRFVTLQPQSAEASYYYAFALWKRPQPHNEPARIAEMESLLKDSLRLDPNLAAADLLLGIVHASAGENSEAVSDYRRALQLDPQLEEAHYRLAQEYRQQGKAAEAKQELSLYAECVKKSAERTERERHEIRQFVYTLRDH